MLNTLKVLDRLLRGESTRPDMLREGEIEIPVGLLSLVVVVLALIYGACMGTYSLFKEIDLAVVASSDRYLQLAATTLKVPLLFFLTVLVTFPSLYVFNALVGSRLRLLPVMQLLVASLGVISAVLASLGPIVAFFSVSTKSYNFMVLFNVLVFAVSGVLGMLFLLQSLNRVSMRLPPGGTTDDGSTGDRPEGAGPESATGSGTDAENEGAAASEADAVPTSLFSTEEVEELGALDAIEGHVLGRHVKVVFSCWIVVFALVGAQMAWVLRPFIGSPNQPFEWFRERDSNFFESVFHTAMKLLTGS